MLGNYVLLEDKLEAGPGLPVAVDVPEWGNMTARQVFYSGRVQGVGFRYTTRQLASGYEVSGWVRNLTDGRVELLAVARDAAELEAFLKELKENSAVAHYIKEVETHPVVPVPEGIRGFSILKK